MTQHHHRIKTCLLCIGLGLSLLLAPAWNYAGTAAAEEKPQQQKEAEEQGPEQQAASQVQAAQPQAKIKDAPGPIKFELTSRMELKYEQIFLEKAGHVHRIVTSGSYAFNSNMSIGVEELPIVRIDTPGHSEDWMLGDIILRYGYVPYVSPSQNLGVVLSTMLTLPTGDFEEGAGYGRYDLEPRLFLPYKFSPTFTIVPAVYEKFTLAKKERGSPHVNLLTLRLINLFYTSPSSYIIVDPRLYYDFEEGKTSGELRFQFGAMLTRTLGAFLEYSSGIGVDRLFEGKAGTGLRYFFR